MVDLGRGGEAAYFRGGNKETLCEGERDEYCSHALCLSSVCIRIHIISSATHILLKADPLSCQNDTAASFIFCWPSIYSNQMLYPAVSVTLKA